MLASSSEALDTQAALGTKKEKNFDYFSFSLAAHRTCLDEGRGKEHCASQIILFMDFSILEPTGTEQKRKFPLL